MDKGKIAKGPIFTLEDSEAFASTLIKVKSSTRYRNEMIKEIKGKLAEWMKNKKFNEFRDKCLDIAIIARVTKGKMDTQDVDNIAKTVLDALKRNDKIDLKSDLFLFENDNQITRLLVYKIQREEDEKYDTDGLDISFRIHDPQKQMILKQRENSSEW